MSKQNTDIKSLAHTKWNCKYHIVFAPKNRRKVFFQEKREGIRDIIRTLCQWKGVSGFCSYVLDIKIVFRICK